MFLKPLKKAINTLFPNLAKLDKLAEAIEEIEVMDDGSLYVKYKNHLVVNTNGSNYTYSKNGNNLIMANILHLNPNSKDIMSNIENDFIGTVNELNTLTIEDQKKMLKNEDK